MTRLAGRDLREGPAHLHISHGHAASWSEFIDARNLASYFNVHRGHFLQLFMTLRRKKRQRLPRWN
jgi:hypothetical protein